MAGGDGGRHIAIERLGHAEVHQVDARRDQKRIEIDGAEQVLQAVLHLVALHGLPLVVGALEDFVGLTVLLLGDERTFRCFSLQR